MKLILWQARGRVGDLWEGDCTWSVRRGFGHAWSRSMDRAITLGYAWFEAVMFSRRKNGE